MPPITATTYAHTIDALVKVQDGHGLARNFDLLDFHVEPLLQGLNPREKTLDINAPSYANLYEKRVKGAWGEMATLHTQVIIALHDHRPDPISQRPRPGGDAITAFAKQHDCLNSLYRWFLSNQTPSGWALPILYQMCRDLKRLAMLADGQHSTRGEKVKELEEASRLMQKCFSACLNDRGADNTTSRKMGTYYMATLLFKTYIKLRSTALCKNLIRGIGAADLAPFHIYPLAHQVSFLYYMGVFAFLREDYDDAEKQFLQALSKVHFKARRNIELILDYLVPILLLRGVLPSSRTLKRSERISAVYEPFIEAYRTGNVRLYDQQLRSAEKRLMERGTYLIVERAREGAVRGLLKKTWVLEGKPARLSIDRFQKYFSAGSGTEIDNEEMECVLANMIYKGLLKGYISHEHQLVVLSKQKPFPWFAPYRDRGDVARKVREEKELAERAKAVVIPPISS